MCAALNHYQDSGKDRLSFCFGTPTSDWSRMTSRLAAAPSKCFRRYQPVIWHGKRTKMIPLGENTIWFSIPSSLIYWRSPHKILLSPSQVNSLELPPFFPRKTAALAIIVVNFSCWRGQVRRRGGHRASQAEAKSGVRGPFLLMIWWFETFFFGELFWQFWNWCFIVFLIYSEMFFFGWLWLLGLNQPRMG